MKKLIWILLLTGCAHGVYNIPVVGPNGRAAHALRCTNTQMCFRVAGETCPTGYSIINTIDSNDPAVKGGTMTPARGRATLIVQCSSQASAAALNTPAPPARSAP